MQYGVIGLGPQAAGIAMAHRVSWVLHRGEIPDGALVLHKCDVPICVNPDHLFLGTQSTNLKDMAAKGRHWRHTQLLCIRGHEFTGMRSGRRICRPCETIRQRARRARKRNDNGK
jgi:hypothetical protein